MKQKIISMLMAIVILVTAMDLNVFALETTVSSGDLANVITEEGSVRASGEEKDNADGILMSLSGNETDGEAKVLLEEQAEGNAETVSENEIEEDLDVEDKEQESKSETVPDDSISNIAGNVSDNDIGNMEETVSGNEVMETVSGNEMESNDDLSVSINQIQSVTANDTDSKIKIGDYITLGTYYGEKILWRCVDIDENGPLMLSDRVLCLKAFDANGESNYHYVEGSFYDIRMDYGSNCYKDSNLRQWLNSTEDTVSWTHNPPAKGNIANGYNAYSNESGFLSADNFTEKELECIKEVTQKIYTNKAEAVRGLVDGGTKKHFVYTSSSIMAQDYNFSDCYYQNVTDKIFIPTLEQIRKIYINFNNGEYINAKPTKNAVENSDYVNVNLNEELYYEYWINHPGTSGYSYEHNCTITSSGRLSTLQAYQGHIGVRPAFYLETEKFDIDYGEGTDDNPYYSIKGFSLQKDAWSFRNGEDGFSYPEGYYIPLERYEEVFGKIYVKCALANEKRFKSMIDFDWGGNCYGMSVTSLLFYLNELDWSKYSKLYNEKFDSINRFYNTINYKYETSLFQKDVWSSIDKESEVAKLIERYQILQYGTDGGFKDGIDSTFDKVASQFWNTEGVKSGDTIDINYNGNYMKDIYKKISESDTPYLISMKSRNGGHALLTRTDKKFSNINEEGWVRIYVYDPNYPYYCDEYINKYGGMPLDYYCNYEINSGEDIYFEINVKTNQWRYQWSTNRWWGSNPETGECYYLKTSLENVGEVHAPEYFNIYYPVERIPKDFECDNKNSLWLPAEGQTDIMVSPNTNFDVYDEEKKLIVAVRNGKAYGYMNGVVFYEYGEYASAEEGNGGRLKIPETIFSIDFKGGEDISVIGDEEVINIDLTGESKMNIDMLSNDISLISENSQEILVQMTDIYSKDEYTSSYIKGVIEENDSIQYSLKDDKIQVNTNMSETSELLLYMDSEETEEVLIGILDEENKEYVSEEIRTENKVDNIKLSKTELSIEVDEMVLIEANYYSDGSIVDDIKWKSEDEDIVIVDGEGNVRGIAPGKTNIIGYTEDGVYSKKCVVEVVPNALWIDNLEEYIYTGKSIKPAIRVYNGTTLLKQGTDYRISYKNNLNANDGSNPASAPTITITGRGN